MPFLFLLETLTRELQRAAVFGHRAHHVIRGAGGNVSLDFQSDLHVGPDQPDQVRDNLVGDAAGVAADAPASSFTGAASMYTEPEI